MALSYLHCSERQTDLSGLSWRIFAILHAEHIYGYELHLHELGLEPDCDTAGDVIMATGPAPTVP
jgi:hypothetical protein